MTTLTSGSLPGDLDVGPSSGLGSVLAPKELAAAMPHLWPTLSGAVGDESIVNRIAEDDFEAAEVLKERSPDHRVPVIEFDRRSDVATGGTK